MRVALLAAILLAVPTVAAADDSSPFDEVAKDATRVRKLDRVVWALTASCEQGDDLDKRQCRILRDAAATKLRGTTIVVDVGAAAVEIGEWDKDKKSTPITVRGCAACTGIVVDGTRYYVVANKAAPKISGDDVKAAALAETSKQFANDALSSGWKTAVEPRLRTELIIKVPADEKKAMWNRDGAKGIAVEVLGFRVYDACDGSVLASEPESGTAPTDRKTCGKTDVATKTKGDTTPAETIYDELSKQQILASLRPAVDEAKACFDTYGVAGDAKIKITIGGDGSIVAMDQSGDFAGTDTGKCIDTAIKKAKFPKSKKAKTTISYPVSLR
jgi:hypothetical protein